jgi:hypothetical protein
LVAQFHYSIAILVADPNVVLRIDCHSLRFVLMADHVVTNCADQFVILVELKQGVCSSWTTVLRPPPQAQIGEWLHGSAPSLPLPAAARPITPVCSFVWEKASDAMRTMQQAIPT